MSSSSPESPVLSSPWWVKMEESGDVPKSRRAHSATLFQTSIKTAAAPATASNSTTSTGHGPQMHEFMIVSGGFTDNDWSTFPVRAFNMTEAVLTGKVKWTDISEFTADDNRAADNKCSQRSPINRPTPPYNGNSANNTTAANGTKPEVLDLWRDAIPCPPQARVGHMSTVYKGHLYIFGGLLYDKENGVFREEENGPHVYRLPITDDLTVDPYASWKRIRPNLNMPSADYIPLLNRGNAQGGMWKSQNKLIMFGGLHVRDEVSTSVHQMVQQDQPLGDVWAYDLETDTWEIMSRAMDLANELVDDYFDFPTPRTAHAATVVGDQLVVYGGMSKVTTEPSWVEMMEWETLYDLWIFDLNKRTWKERFMTPTLARAYHSLVGWPDEKGETVVAAFGGYRTVEQPVGEEVAVVFDDTLVSRPVPLNSSDIPTWEKAIPHDASELTASNRLEHSAVLSEAYGAMFVWGGRFQKTEQISGVWALNIHGPNSQIQFKQAEGDGLEQYEATVAALHMLLAALMFMSMLFSALCGIISRQQAQEAAQQNGNGGNGENGGAPVGRRRRGLNQDAIDTLPVKTYESNPSTASEAGSEGRDASAEGDTEASGANADAAADTDDDCCPICLVEYEDGDELRTLLCKHEFHKECVDSWLSSNASCPACRYSLQGLTAPSSSSSPFVLPPNFLLPYGFVRDPLATEENQASSTEQAEAPASNTSATRRGSLLSVIRRLGSNRRRRHWYPGARISTHVRTTIDAEEFDDSDDGVQIELPYVSSLELTEEPVNGDENSADATSSNGNNNNEQNGSSQNSEWGRREPRTRRMRLGRDGSNRRRLRRSIRRGMQGGSVPLTETLEPSDTAIV